MRARIAVIMLLFGTFTSAAPASAGGSTPPGLWSGPPASVSAQPVPPERQYYGWKLIPVDLASVALIAWGPEGVRRIGVAGYLASGIIFHVLHDNGQRAGESILMRAGLPALGWVAGGLVGGLAVEYGCPGDTCENDLIVWEEFWDHDSAVAGAFVGIGLALVLDWAKLGWAEKPHPTGPSILAPQVTIDEQGLSIGVLGRF